MLLLIFQSIFSCFIPFNAHIAMCAQGIHQQGKVSFGCKSSII